MAAYARTPATALRIATDRAVTVRAAAPRTTGTGPVADRREAARLVGELERLLLGVSGADR